MGDEKQFCRNCHFLMLEKTTKEVIPPDELPYSLQGRATPLTRPVTKREVLERPDRDRLKEKKWKEVGGFISNYEVACFHKVWPNIKLESQHPTHKDDFYQFVDAAVNEKDRTDFCFFHPNTEGIDFKPAERVRIRKWEIEQAKIQRDFQKKQSIEQEHSNSMQAQIQREFLKKQAEEQRKFSEEQAAAHRKIAKTERNVLIATLFVLILTMCTNAIASGLTGIDLKIFIALVVITLSVYLLFVSPGWFFKWISSREDRGE